MKSFEELSSDTEQLTYAILDTCKDRTIDEVKSALCIILSSFMKDLNLEGACNEADFMKQYILSCYVIGKHVTERSKEGKE